MAYLALYRKFRPNGFDEVIGQEHIVRTLTNQIKNGNISHAYLFCGTRGTGKTSCARSFAKAINCISPNNGSACGKCEVCSAYENGNGLDIVEIDAASNNRVDEIRDLREKVNYSPTIGKYKVYIIDEVHMLTESAFNALLKTLEEPPSHAVFILCTTEAHKLPATILSRCTRFDFRLVSTNDLEKHLKNIFEKSNIKSDDESIKLIAKTGAGSVRDTLSTAEMCAAFCDNNITYEKVLDCLGITNNDTLFKIVNSIIMKDAKGLLNILKDMENHGKNLVALMKDLSDYINKVLVFYFSNDATSLALPEEDVLNIKQLSKLTSGANLLNYLNIIAEAETSLKLCLNPNMLVEITLLKCIETIDEIEGLKRRIEELEKKTKNGVILQEENSQENKEKESISVVENVSSFKEEKKTKNLSAKQIFGELVNHFKNQKMFLAYATCGDIKEVKIENDKFIIVCLKDEFMVLNQNKKQIEDFLLEKNNGLKLEFNIVESKVEKSISVTEELKEKLGEKLVIKN